MEMQAAGTSIVATIQKLSEQFPKNAQPFHSIEIKKIQHKAGF
ncbi:hypothetical protein [Chryseomicrobium excrementi]|nr:hypothetical protein [Chryseomicrobium excrementi]